MKDGEGWIPMGAGYWQINTGGPVWWAPSGTSLDSPSEWTYLGELAALLHTQEEPMATRTDLAAIPVSPVLVVVPAKVTARLANGTHTVTLEMDEPAPLHPYRIEIPEEQRPALKAGKELVIETRWSYGQTSRPAPIEHGGPLLAVTMSWEPGAAEQTPILAETPADDGARSQ